MEPVDEGFPGAYSLINRVIIVTGQSPVMNNVP